MSRRPYPNEPEHKRMDFIDFLRDLTTVDNAVRQQAEIKYKYLQDEGGDELILRLLHTTAPTLSNNLALNESLEHLRSLAIVLLRRLLIDQEVSSYRGMTPQGQIMLRHGLMYALEHEKAESPLQSRICELIGEFGGYILEKDEWPEILPFAYQKVQSTLPNDREMGLTLMGLLSSSHISFLLSSPENINTIINIYSVNLIDLSNKGRVLLASIRSITSILTSINQESELDQFQPLLAPLLTGFKQLISLMLTGEINESIIISYLESFIDIIDYKASKSFHRNHNSNCFHLHNSLQRPLQSFLSRISNPSRHFQGFPS